MIFFKPVLFYLLIFSCLAYSSSLFAQKTSPKNPWMIGVEAGVNIYIDCHACNEKESVTTMLASSAFTHYRLKRWVGVSANFAHYRMHTYSSASLWDTESYLVPLTQRDFRTNMLALSIGPQLLIRIGQGDLGFEVRYGRVYSTTRLNALTLEGQTYDIKYKSEFSDSESYKLRYTYWPKPRFGVNISLEITDTTRRKRLSEDLSPKTALEEVYPDIKPEVLAQIVPRPEDASFFNIMLGVTYHFK